ncbi:MAG: hypothetical protein LC121_04855 [Anaerolineae bacterium]|nr:hypothetical protein [Anaerolineae bacterium]
MRRGVLLLNLLLVAAIGLSGWQIGRQYRATLERQRQYLSRRVAAPAPPILTLPADPPLIHAVNYLDVAARLPFSVDRNPTVVVEAAPPKPMPPLPAYHGMMNLGQGPRVILSSASAPQRSYQVGEKVGEFKLVAVADSGLVFEWDGKQVPASYIELARRAAQTAQSSAQAAPAASAPAAGASSPAAGAPAPAQAASVTSIAGGAASGPAAAAPAGGPMGAVADFTGERLCKSDDNSPDGTIVNGFKKVSTRSPFGVICRWVPVR